MFLCGRLTWWPVVRQSCSASPGLHAKGRVARAPFGVSVSRVAIPWQSQVALRSIIEKYGGRALRLAAAPACALCVRHLKQASTLPVLVVLEYFYIQRHIVSSTLKLLVLIAGWYHRRVHATGLHSHQRNRERPLVDVQGRHEAKQLQEKAEKLEKGCPRDCSFCSDPAY